MQAFIVGHATHPDGHMALALAAAQVEARRARRQPAFQPTLGLVYLTDALAPQADALLAELQQRWPGVHWAGNVGIGVMAGGVEYVDEPALVLMLCDLPPASFRLFSGRQPMPAGWAHSALVHADPATHDLDDLLTELAGRTDSGYLFGGLTASRGRRLHIADGVFEGGLSGVAFLAHDPTDPVPAPRLVSRVTQGCQPLGPTRRVTAAEGNLALTLDGQPALPLLLDELQVSLQQPQQAMAALRSTLVGLTDDADAALNRGGQFGSDTRVRHLIGIDPGRQGIAVAEHLELGQQFAFCRRDVAAARRDLVRICAEIRDEIESDAAAPVGAAMPDGRTPAPRIVGAVYVSCSGRGGPHFGAPSAEAQIVQHALGGLGEEVPLVGFFAAGEIARHHLYGYTGVLTVFTGA
jgi:small ligand-binding sensory domain FIST